MKRFILAALAALTMAFGCKTEDYDPPPVAGVTEESGTSNGQCETDDHCIPGSSSSADTSAGAPVCVEGDGAAWYTCRGWAACVYYNPNATTYKYKWDFSPTHDNFSECKKFDMCMTYAGQPDNEEIYAACKEEAPKVKPITCPTHPYVGGEAWTLDRAEYIFDDNANLAVIDNVPGQYAYGLSDHCSWIPTTSTDNAGQQCLGGGCMPDATCPAIHEQSCSGWQPSTHITSSTDTTTHRITATIEKAWLTTLAQDMFDSVYVCDSGTWTWSLSATPDKWRMQNLGTSDFMYRLGFRNSDEQIRIKKYGTSTWYNLYDTTMLGGYDKMATAFGALQNETHFTLELKRGSPLQVTYTMDLTLTN